MISGLSIIENFLSEEEEREILSILPPPDKKTGGGRSDIKRYGRKVYPNAHIQDTLPEWSNFLADRLVSGGFLKERPTHLTLNKYNISATIEPHIDSKDSGEVISIISLGFEATMVFTKKNERVEIILPPRSLTLMGGESRWDFKHQILPVRGLRYSLVFRE